MFDLFIIKYSITLLLLMLSLLVYKTHSICVGKDKLTEVGGGIEV